ncbi:DUF3985 domain-containing protein (plasmid) [Bacillus sp. JAS24-2]|uniref:DUF3985 family protein n=1 Tax=Bacillus sp. JAS24-2 TaxID=2217832 RepID=UPI0011EFA5ED|nr:DUF3985 family protein [Bacillus sp. JAS24-2]QEL82905.1 DUF3985 domain-containing protein [Bacillus sp. JAS24-2]
MGIIMFILLGLLIYVFCKVIFKVTYVTLKLLAIVVIIVFIVKLGEKLLSL